MSVVTRFAPSPTGFLHIGGVRTALFNWLYARRMGGVFLLRIEDTDKARSTPEAVAAIQEGLDWMGLVPDGPVVSQASRADAHVAAADKLLAQGAAYRCYATPDELAAMRAEQEAKGLPPRYDGRWRDRDPSEAPSGVDPVIRFRAPQSGSRTLEDLVQGAVTVENQQLDDLVILRSDRSPTYNLAVVVDDADMGVTHVIRGDDHLNNAFRQAALYDALGLSLPQFAHIPLIHGSDGAKLSKRHGALGVEAYRDLGYLPDALFNALLKLGWGHGDTEIFSRAEALEHFDLSGVNKAPARFDLAKLSALNAHYLRALPLDKLWNWAEPFVRAKGWTLDAEAEARLKRGLPALAERSQTLAELAELSRFYLAEPPFEIEPKAAKALDEAGLARLAELRVLLAAQHDWEAETLQTLFQGYASDSGLKMGQVFQPLRAALTGAMSSPGVVEVAWAFGRDKTLRHLDAQLETR